MDRKRILVVDDEPDFTELIKEALQSTGKYEVKTENSGKAGIISAQVFKPDLILLDIMMPGMEGSYVAEQIKKDERIKTTPIIFLTATVTAEEASDAEGILGKHPVISKPVELAHLISSIDKYLQ